MSTATNEIWESFIALAVSLGPVREGRSRFSDKPAAFMGAREIAHTEAPGHIDLRITAQAWRELRADWSGDPAVTATAGRRDWIELEVATPHHLTRLAPLIVAAVSANL